MITTWRESGVFRLPVPSLPPGETTRARIQSSTVSDHLLLWWVLRSLLVLVWLVVIPLVAHPTAILLFHEQGTPPALIQREFGEFLDLLEGAPLDLTTCRIAIDLIKAMSRPYRNTPDDRERGSEKERARVFRKLMLDLMKHHLGPDAVSTIEPSTVQLVSL
jgi:hypothetical protein